MYYDVTIYPCKKTYSIPKGTNLLTFLRNEEIVLNNPCGGHGTCGKCRVIMETKEWAREVLSCCTVITQDAVIHIPEQISASVLTKSNPVSVPMKPYRPGPLIAFDIGTTTIVCYLLDGKNGRELSCASMQNPQSIYGADVISRIQAALNGKLHALQSLICNAMSDLIRKVCSETNIHTNEISVISVVGNPCMQQLFLGLSPENLVQIPFYPILKKAEIQSASALLPVCPNSSILVVPDLSGYIGADTIGCILSTNLCQAAAPVLMVDIGTNGEMVLSAHGRMAACAAAAGPALEGAKIHFGMRGCEGAIDHVWTENGRICVSTINNKKAIGICGSGLIDAAAVFLTEGIINRRGRIQAADSVSAFRQCIKEIDKQRVFFLTDDIYLTQDDLRELQLAKGAIAAGIRLMVSHLNIALSEIDTVLLAGAFGTFIRPESACKIGLIPEIPVEKIHAVGNAAGGGAKIMACNDDRFQSTDRLVSEIEFLELASLPAFQSCFARNMMFPEQKSN